MDAGCAGWSVAALGEHSIQPDYDGTPMVTDVMKRRGGLRVPEVLRERRRGHRAADVCADRQGEPRRHVQRRARPEVVGTARGDLRASRYCTNIVQAADGVPEMHRGLLAWLESCHQRGLYVYGQGETNRNFQQFDFTTWNGFDIAPGWKAALMGTPAERLANLRNPEMRAAMLADRPWLMAIEGLGMKLDLFRRRLVGGVAAAVPYVGGPWARSPPPRARTSSRS